MAAEAVFAKVKAYLDARDKSIPSLVPYTFKFIVTSGGAVVKTYFLDLVNFTVNNDESATADVTLTLDREQVLELFSQKAEAAELIKAGKALVAGNPEILAKLKPFLDKFRESS